MTYETPGLTWHGAFGYYIEQGGWLALPANPTDQARLASVMPAPGSIWIRYNDVNKEGHWFDWLY